MEQLCEFLQVSFEPAMLDLRMRVRHNVNGNDMKYAPGELKLDLTWQQALTQQDLAYFERYAGKLNRQLGYG